MRFDSRVLSFKSAYESTAMIGDAGVAINELLIEDAIMFVEGSHVELLDAAFVDCPALIAPLGC